MEPVVRQDLPISLSVDALMATLNIGAEFEEEFRGVFDACARIARPKYMFLSADARQDESATYIGDEAFQSRVMRVNLEGVARVYLYAATCGRELYEHARRQDDPLVRYWVDAISEHALYQASNLCLREIRDLAGSEDVNSMNPGSLSDFPITDQKPLFRLLGDVFGLIGIELTGNCLMLPYKSLSGIYFVSGKHFVNCALCQRVNCPNRRAEFDEMLFHSTYAL